MKRIFYKVLACWQVVKLSFFVLFMNSCTAFRHHSSLVPIQISGWGTLLLITGRSGYQMMPYKQSKSKLMSYNLTDMKVFSPMQRFAMPSQKPKPIIKLRVIDLAIVKVYSLSLKWIIKFFLSLLNQLQYWLIYWLNFSWYNVNWQFWPILTKRCLKCTILLWY